MLGYFINRLPGFLSEVNSFHFSRNSTRNVLIGRIIMTRKQNPVWKNLRRLFTCTVSPLSPTASFSVSFSSRGAPWPGYKCEQSIPGGNHGRVVPSAGSDSFSLSIMGTGGVRESSEVSNLELRDSTGWQHQSCASSDVAAARRSFSVTISDDKTWMCWHERPFLQLLRHTSAASA